MKFAEGSYPPVSAARSALTPGDPVSANGRDMNGSGYRTSAVSSTLKRSVMRDLLQLISAPDVISLAGGLPAGEFLPLQQLQQCLNDVLHQDGATALQYSTQHQALRCWIAGYMQRRGVVCTPGQVFITSGAQQGLTILTHLFLDSGSPAVIEQITFTGIRQALACRQAEVRAVPVEMNEGVDVDALEHAFRQSPCPRMAVLIPDFHNPLGVSLPLEKRKRIAALAARYRVPVVEDDPYSALRFAGEQLPPIKAFDQADMVFYVGSFSKMLAPACRLGWIVAPDELIPQITVLRESLDLESSTLMQRAVARFLSQGMLEAHLSRLVAAHQARYDILCAALDESLAPLAAPADANAGDGIAWTRPEGGLFSWVTLPRHVDTWSLLPKAIEHGVAYVPGVAFDGEGGSGNALRLNFSNVQPGRIAAAVQRLAEVIGDNI